ncbi:MAG: hypothetical protein RJQ09_21345 [Cyclobacteriaceae bacterium]
MTKTTQKHREILEVRHLLRKRDNRDTSWTDKFLECNYFIERWTIYKIDKSLMELPFNPDNASVIYKLVASGEYYQLDGGDPSASSGAHPAQQTLNFQTQ